MTIDVEMVEHACPTEGCGVTFWTTDKYADRRRDDHKAFYCLNGHILSYPGKTDAQKLSQERAEKQRLLNERTSLHSRIAELEAKKQRKHAKKVPVKRKPK